MTTGCLLSIPVCACNGSKGQVLLQGHALFWCQKCQPMQAHHLHVFVMLVGCSGWWCCCWQVSKRRLIGRAAWALLGGRFWSEREVLWPLAKLPEEACRQYRQYRDAMVSMRSLDPPRVRRRGVGSLDHGGRPT
jgi:hypothetical protein